MSNPDDRTVLMVLTILDLLGTRKTPEEVIANYRLWEKVLKERPIR